MADPRAVIEGSLKYRDGRKWKARWCVISKLSPVADCLHLQLYRDSKDRCKNGPTKASLSLEGFLGMETGFTLDKESNTMALICNEVVVVLAFDCRELLIQWQVKIRTNLAEDQQFLVQISHVPAKSKIACGPAHLHLQDYTFCLASGVPPRLLGVWPLKELRRFGVVDGKFCFEGGSKCGKGEGLHVILSNQEDELSQAFELASKGKLLGKRKVPSAKNSYLESSSCSSPLRNKQMYKASTESTRPLLSSESEEGSVCDACAADIASLDEAYVSSSTCGGIHYGWPNCSTTTKEDAISISTNRESVLSRSTLRSLGNSAGLLCDGRTTWSLCHCSKCGRHYCRRIADSQGLYASDVPEEFTPHWTMESGALSPLGEVAHRTLCSRRPIADRSSVCSQGSHSSGNSSGSEYSVPRSTISESYYDRPKSVHQPGNMTFKLPTDQRHLTTIRETCTCQTLPRNWSVESSSVSMDKMDTQIKSEEPCTCRTGAYGNYDVPRSALLSNPFLSDLSENRMSTISENYDVPRSIKDKLGCDCDGTGQRLNLHSNLCQSVLSNSNLTKEKPLMCTCQRVMVWAGNLVPCWEKTSQDETHTHSNMSNSYINDSLSCKEPSSIPRPDPWENPSTTNPTPRFSPVKTPRKSVANSKIPNYVNLTFQQENDANSSKPESGATLPNYENLHFIQSIPFNKEDSVIPEEPHHRHDDASVNRNSLLLESSSPCFKCPVCTYKKSESDDGYQSKQNDDIDPDTYELMSYELKKGKDERDDNYLVMYPVYSDKPSSPVSPTVPEITAPTIEDTDKNDINLNSSNKFKEEAILPLRPFMPLLLPFQERAPIAPLPPKSPIAKKPKDATILRNIRSSSLGDIKKKEYSKSRSNSAESRAVKNGSERNPSPKTTPIKKQTFLSRLTLRSKEKSFSTDEISPPASGPTTPNNIFIEAIHRYSFHKSADCLQLKEEMRLSEEDLTQEPENENLENNYINPLLSPSIKRSSSVPCKTNQKSKSVLCSKSSDSRSLPRNSKPSRISASPGMYNSLPESHQQGKVLNPTIMKTPDHRDNAQIIQTGITSFDCKLCQQAVTSPEAFILMDSKSTTSSSSSDMSDYIESLSLCSHSSSGSSADYVRAGEISNLRHTCSTSALRPRSGKEYHSLDRMAHFYHPNFEGLDTKSLHHHNHNHHCEGLHFENKGDHRKGTSKANSPSPGYASSSPNNLESHSPTKHFIFAKEPS